MDTAQGVMGEGNGGGSCLFHASTQTFSNCTAGCYGYMDGNNVPNVDCGGGSFGYVDYGAGGGADSGAAGGGGTSSGNGGGPGTGGWAPGDPSPYGSKLAAAARSLEGTSSNNLNIPGVTAAIACTVMVNIVINSQLGHRYGTINVPGMVKAMDAATGCVWKFTDHTLAQPGDIAVQDGNDYANAWNPNSPAQGHVGVCMDNGCTEIDSNSSSQHEFMNNFHDPNFGLPANEPATYYRLYC